VEFVIQILKKAGKLASKAEARRREAWGRSVAMLIGIRPVAQGRLEGCGGLCPPRYGSFSTHIRISPL
jgi:hypothetical protein